VKVTPRIEEGSPSRKIVELSSEHDLIVMGTLGRTGFSKLLLGSVAERVVRFAKCPVLVVRATGEEH
jgi:nucleotide-binding universal stress UspA family protein